jgi:predicted MPP superfamily phosphohydrolase
MALFFCCRKAKGLVWGSFFATIPPMDSFLNALLSIHGLAFKHTLLFGLVWFSWLVFPFLVLLAWWFVRSFFRRPRFAWLWRFVLLGFFVLSLLFVYARFYERYSLQVAQHTMALPGITDKKIVVWADPHLGVLKGASWLQEVVDATNAQNPDLVLIPGDFTFSPQESNLPDLFAPLADLKAPTYAILGNHDLPSDRDVPTISITKALTKVGVILIDEKTINFSFPDGQNCWLIGAGDIWNYPFNGDLWSGLPRGACSIVITHDPDRSLEMRDAGLSADLLVSGHTHGGQVWLPFVDMQKIIPTNYPFVQGWYQIGQTPVLVTPGVGETLLPLRFGVPPQIEVITVQ